MPFPFRHGPTFPHLPISTRPTYLPLVTKGNLDNPGCPNVVTSTGSTLLSSVRQTRVRFTEAAVLKRNMDLSFSKSILRGLLFSISYEDTVPRYSLLGKGCSGDRRWISVKYD